MSELRITEETVQAKYDREWKAAQEAADSVTRRIAHKVDILVPLTEGEKTRKTDDH